MEFEFTIMSNLSQTTSQKEQQAFHIILTLDAKHPFNYETMRAIAIDYMTEIEEDAEAYWVDAYDNEIHIITYRDKGEFYNLRDELLLMQLERDYTCRAAGLPTPLTEWKDIGSGEPFPFGKTYRHTTFNLVLTESLSDCTCTTLEGLNMVLQDNHMLASVEEDGSVTEGKKELTYYELDKDGQRLSPGISASELADDLRLEYLERKFAWCRENISLRSLPLKWVIDGISSIPRLSISAFVKKMETKGKSCLIQYDENNRPINIWYRDNEGKVTIDGASLGGNYTIEAIIQKCSA